MCSSKERIVVQAVKWKQELTTSQLKRRPENSRVCCCLQEELTKLQNLLKVQLGLKFNLAKDKELESLQAELSSL